MIRSIRLKAALLLCLVAPVSIGAAETNPALDLIPKDAAGFVHIRFGDIWKHDAFAPVRDYLTKTEPVLLKEFDGQFGFVPGDVDSLTLIFPSFSRQLAAPPLIVVRTIKPYDKAKVVTAMRGISIRQLDEMERRHGFGPGAEFAPAKSAPKTSDAPLPPLPPLPQKNFEPQCGQNKEEPAFEPDSDEPPVPRPDLRAHHFLLSRSRGHLYCLDERTLVFVTNSGPEADFAIMPYLAQLLRRQENGPLAPALAEAGKHTAVIAVDCASFVKMLPDKLGSENARLLSPLMKSKTAMLTLDLGKELVGTFTFQADSAADAKKLEDAVNGSIAAIKQNVPEWRKKAKQATLPDLANLLVDQIELASNKFTVKQSDNAVTATTALQPDAAFTAALKAGVAQIKIARERVISQNNLKQIGIALHNYHDANGRFPFPGVAKFGAPLGPGNNNPNLSWRVAILPYIEQQALYQQFKLDEPWDSEHNKTLIARMPKMYAPVNGVKAEKGHTLYQIFAGREAQKSGLRITDVTDGLSNTLMVVEAGDSVPWTRPDDMLYDAKKPLPKLGACFDGSFNALLMDGSVRFIHKSIDEKTLRALITIAGGEVVGDWEK